MPTTNTIPKWTNSWLEADPVTFTVRWHQKPVLRKPESRRFQSRAASWRGPILPWLLQPMDGNFLARIGIEHEITWERQVHPTVRIKLRWLIRIRIFGGFHLAIDRPWRHVTHLCSQGQSCMRRKQIDFHLESIF